MSNEINPFQSPSFIPPQADDALGITPGRRRVRPFRSAHGLAIFSMIMIGAVCLTSAALMYSSYLQVELLEKASHGIRITQAEAFANDSRQQLCVGLRMVSYIVSGIVFLTWFYRVYCNLPSLGTAATEYTPGWAVGWWFVPFASLVVPFQVSREIWKGSHPANLGVRSKTDLVGSPLVGFWWTFWLIMVLVGSTTAFWRPDPKSIDEIISASWAVVYSMGATLPAGFLAVLFVAGVNSNQAERHVLYAQRLAAAKQSEFDDPVSDDTPLDFGGQRFSSSDSRPEGTSGGGEEGIDDWLRKL
jgi:hypothetical protein